MRKYIAAFLCMALVLCAGIPAFAFDGSQNQYEYALQVLKEYGVLEEEQQWEFDIDSITRREALQIIDNITEAYHHITPGQTMQEVLGFAFADVTDGTEDAYLAMGLCRMGLFNGRFDEMGNRIADLDGFITNNEGLALLTRMLSMHTVSSEYSEELLRGLLGGGDDWLYVFAQRLNLINSDNPLDNGVTLSLDEKDEPMKASTFIRLVHRSLYIPYTNIRNSYALEYLFQNLQIQQGN